MARYYNAQTFCDPRRPHNCIPLLGAVESYLDRALQLIVAALVEQKAINMKETAELPCIVGEVHAPAARRSHSVNMVCVQRPHLGSAILPKRLKSFNIEHFQTQSFDEGISKASFTTISPSDVLLSILSQTPVCP